MQWQCITAECHMTNDSKETQGLHKESENMSNNEWCHGLPALWTWSTHCWCPSDTVHRWESQCRPFYCPSQSVSQHHWQTPANALNHSSSLSCPIRRHYPIRKVAYVAFLKSCLVLKMKFLHFSFLFPSFTNLKKTNSYPTNSCLHDGIKATFWHINICRHTLFCDYLVELVSATRQRQDMFIAKRW